MDFIPFGLFVRPILQSPIEPFRVIFLERLAVSPNFHFLVLGMLGIAVDFQEFVKSVDAADVFRRRSFRPVQQRRIAEIIILDDRFELDAELPAVPEIIAVLEIAVLL